ncbi:MAG: hypothetical protein ACXQT0_00885 [Candidatus Methanofastidiosia archaeon]
MNCPSCDRVISDKVGMCPHCGYLLDYYGKAPRQMNLAKYLGAIALVIIVALAIGLYLSSEGSSDNDFVPSEALFYAEMEYGEFFDNMSPYLNHSMSVAVWDNDSIFKCYADKVMVFSQGGGQDNVVLAFATFDRPAVQSLLEERFLESSPQDVGGADVYYIDEDKGYLWFDDVLLYGDIKGLGACIDAYFGNASSLGDSDSFAYFLDVMSDSQMKLFFSKEAVIAMGLDSSAQTGLPEMEGIASMGTGFSFSNCELHSTTLLELCSSEDASAVAANIREFVDTYTAAMGGELDVSVEEDGPYVIILQSVLYGDGWEFKGEGFFYYLNNLFNL